MVAKVYRTLALEAAIWPSKQAEAATLTAIRQVKAALSMSPLAQAATAWATTQAATLVSSISPLATEVLVALAQITAEDHPGVTLVASL
jgi:hypothetical protein